MINTNQGLNVSIRTLWFNRRVCYLWCNAYYLWFDADDVALVLALFLAGVF